MPNIKSAKKRVLVSRQENAANRAAKTALKLRSRSLMLLLLPVKAILMQFIVSRFPSSIRLLLPV